MSIINLEDPDSLSNKNGDKNAFLKKSSTDSHGGQVNSWYDSLAHNDINDTDVGEANDDYVGAAVFTAYTVPDHNVYEFPPGLTNTSSDKFGVYANALHFYATEQTRTKLLAAGRSSDFGHMGNTGALQDHDLCSIFLPYPDDLDNVYDHSFRDENLSAEEMANAHWHGFSPAHGLDVLWKSAFGEYIKRQQNEGNQTVNVKTALIYEGPQLRRLNLSWTLLPGSMDEVKILDRIIYTFEKYSSPMATLDSDYMIIPAKWVIEEFPIIGKRNYKLYWFGPAVITSLSIKRSDEYFYNGDPTRVILQMQLTETAVINRPDIIGFGRKGSGEVK